MARVKSADISEITRTMLRYPWLKDTYYTKELKEVMTHALLPLSYYQSPKEEFPLQPECWRQHRGKLNLVPSCYSKKFEMYTHWLTVYDWQKERENEKMLRKMRDNARYLKEGTHIPNCYPPMSKLATRYQVGSRPFEPIIDPQKWQRLKELTEMLKSPREDEQFYAAHALGCLGSRDKFVMEALWQVAHSGKKKVKYEAYRTLAILGCLNKHVIQAFIKELKGKNEGRRMETLMGLRAALNSWAAVPKDKRIQIGDEETLVDVLQTVIKNSSHEAALEAALCLGFLRPCSQMAQEFLLECLGQRPKTQQMKALRMLVKVMHVHSAAVITAILDQLCSAVILEDRFEAIQMLRIIGLEKIQAHGLEEITFDLLKRKTHNEPFHAVRQAVAEAIEDLKMKPMMLNLMEEQLMDPNPAARQEAVISLGVLGIRGSQVFYLLLDMLDTEENQAMKKSLQETLILCASTDPWIQNMLKNKVFYVYEAPKTNEKAKPTGFWKESEKPEELNIQDFRLAKLNPLLIAKSISKSDQKKKLHAFSPCFRKPQKETPEVTGPWEPGIRKQLRILAQSSK
ncbi:protein HEATR9 isoform X1 [Urocitellus parryii]|uniref:protein HEATR9 isoform X1 n=1 Tax=Urocitellus parryii TaxID=9999 RepID=UPI000E55E878|nr:protein HEATR9 isoform X1 [Urocitellus parryii]